MSSQDQNSKFKELSTKINFQKVFLFLEPLGWSNLMPTRISGTSLTPLKNQVLLSVISKWLRWLY